MSETADSLLQAANLAIAAAALLLVGAYSARALAGRRRKPRMRTCAAILFLAGILIFVRTWWTGDSAFPPGTPGILVLRLAGDDHGALQRELAARLNQAFAADSLTTNLSVRT